MTRISERLKKLEQSPKLAGEAIWMTVEQDRENPGNYNQKYPEKRTWTRPELDALPNNYHVIIISWTKHANPE